MLETLGLFMIVIQAVALVTVAAAVYIIGFKQIDGDSQDGVEGKGEPLFFKNQFKYCKWATVIILAVGWFFGDMEQMGGFPGICKFAGIFWCFLGVVFTVSLIVSLVTNAKKPIRDYLRNFAASNITFGIFVSVLSWLLWL